MKVLRILTVLARRFSPFILLVSLYFGLTQGKGDQTVFAAIIAVSLPFVVYMAVKELRQGSTPEVNESLRRLALSFKGGAILFAGYTGVWLYLNQDNLYRALPWLLLALGGVVAALWASRLRLR
jgi:hypothetical protein